MAAFQHILNHSKCRDFIKEGTGDDHRLLVEYLKNSADPGLKKIGYGFLPRLRALRNRADYEMSPPFTKGAAEDAMERASEIVYEFLP